MARVYTELLGRAYRQTTGAFQLFVADNEFAYVVRDLAIYNGSSLVDTFYLYVVSGTSPYYLLVQSLEGLKSAHLSIRQRLLPGDELWGSAVTTPWSVSITGYALTLP